MVEKGLNDFLDTKKMSFPRFYFLSNDELLEILSEAKDPLKIQPFVRKIFEAVKDLKFEDGNMMTAMFSVEGEQVTFNAGVDPHRSNAVEIWLGATRPPLRASRASILANHGVLVLAFLQSRKSMYQERCRSFNVMLVICASVIASSFISVR